LQRKEKYVEEKINKEFYFDYETLFEEEKEIADCVSCESSHILYILYTSGTTGEPKGIMRDQGGTTVALDWAMNHIFDIQKKDVWFAASDIGWVVGHSFIVYGPLIRGGTSIIFEGKPILPDAGVFWRIIE